MTDDILIAGAGPAGLCLALALADCGLRITLLDPQQEAALAAPASDGREIALTQSSVQLLARFGVWARIPDAMKSPLRDARVMNGRSRFTMTISHQLTGSSALGWLVGNSHIRLAAWQALQAAIAGGSDIHVCCGVSVTGVRHAPDHLVIMDSAGGEHAARLLVAADSRFSPTRRAMGIAADMHDFGRSMLVCPMRHEQPHGQVAWEWFDYGQTLALLPMNDDLEHGGPRSSVVITLPSHDMDTLRGMPPEAFDEEVTRRYDGRLGRMRLVGERHVYPLVSVYPRQLVARRFACVGDAAVGMHPVTAHGFNFGLQGIDRLAGLIRVARATGCDIAHDDLLAAYQRGHRLATRPLYLATQLLTRLYTGESPPARMLRDAVLHIGERLVPVKRLIASSLSKT